MSTERPFRFASAPSSPGARFQGIGLQFGWWNQAEMWLPDRPLGFSLAFGEFGLRKSFLAHNIIQRDYLFWFFKSILQYMDMVIRFITSKDS